MRVEKNKNFYSLLRQKTRFFRLGLKIRFRRLDYIKVQSKISLIFHDKLKYIDPIDIIIRKLYFIRLDGYLKLGVLFLIGIIMIKLSYDEGSRRHKTDLQKYLIILYF